MLAQTMQYTVIRIVSWSSLWNLNTILRNSIQTVKYVFHAARITINNLRNKFSELDVPVLLNKNIDVDCLGVKGLHLNKKGTGKLAVNFISFNR